MSRTSVEVSIAPDVFQWLCSTSGWPAKDIAKSIEVSETEVRSWCEGKTKPVLPLSKVERLSVAFKRPLAAFLLSKAPAEPAALPDFRKLPNASAGYSKETRLAMRKARRLQQVRCNLLENLEIDTRVKIRLRTIRDNPEVVASEERGNLPSGISGSEITSSKVFHIWREWFEEKNIAVFQMKMPIEDARGFSLSETEPFVIVVNESDAPVGRLFTLFHEYGHILLNKPAICNQDSDEVEDRSKAGIERWCNRFAGAFLVPQSSIERDLVIQRYLQSSNYSRAAGSIASKFRISRESALMRLLTLDYISPAVFRRERDQIRADAAAKIAEQKEKQRLKGEEEDKGFGVSSDRRCIEEKGRPFISLVMKNADLGHITSNDALDYLDIKLRHLEKLRA